LPQADVVIHTVPRQAKAESIFDRVRAVAARHNVSVHELSARSYLGRLRVEQHLELDETLPLLEAHNFVTAMETEILREVPEVDTVLTHIESEPATIEQPEELDLVDRQIELAMRATAAQIPEIADVHEVEVRRQGEHIYVACHCTLPDEMTMQRVHGVITEFEDRFRKQCPEIDRVTIHPEPATDNSR
jgi:divalent metal cation (Fe/Co/Zn/Cd) transporter